MSFSKDLTAASTTSRTSRLETVLNVLAVLGAIITAAFLVSGERLLERLIGG